MFLKISGGRIGRVLINNLLGKGVRSPRCLHSCFFIPSQMTALTAEKKTSEAENEFSLYARSVFHSEQCSNVITLHGLRHGGGLVLLIDYLRVFNARTQRHI